MTFKAQGNFCGWGKGKESKGLIADPSSYVTVLYIQTRCGGRLQQWRGMALAERLITSLSCCACVMLAGGGKDSKGLQIDPSSYVTVLYKYKEGCGDMQ